MSKSLAQIREQITPIFKQYGIMYADVFGSRARGRAKKSSDLDMLVTLKEPIGLYKFNELNDKLESKLRLKVDLLTHKSVSPYLKPYIKKDLVRIYEEK
jgi:uncharacterized protein